MYTDFLAKAVAAADMEFVKKHSLKLHELEKSTSNDDFKASTAYVMEVMREAGFDDIERYALPCDGKTAYDDCIMPEAWDRTGRSTLCEVDPSDGNILQTLADTDIEPINAVIWSIPTPPGGITAELARWQNGSDEDFSKFAGKIVLCNTSPAGKFVDRLVEAGALGTVSYVQETLETDPDSVRWMNGVGYCGWYYTKEERRLWNFSITPRCGNALAERLDKGEKITLKAVMNTRVYDGETYTVTGHIPGKSGKEFAFFAHMYEPFIADDSAGVILSIAVGKALKELAAKGDIPQPDKGLRVVFSMERFGFSEFFHKSPYMKDIIASNNMDSVCHASLKIAGVPLELRHSPASAPFFDVAVIREYLENFYPQVKFVETPGNLSDDTFSADSPFNVPSFWLHTPPAKFRHHNTGDVFAAADWDIAACVLEVMTAYLAEVCTVTGRDNGGRELTERIVAALKRDAAKEFARLQEDSRLGKCSGREAKIVSSFLKEYFTARLYSLEKLGCGMVTAADIEKLSASFEETDMPDEKELEGDEKIMSQMIITRHPEIRQIMSLKLVPKSERASITYRPEMLLLALLDGKRDLYSAYVISKFMLKREMVCDAAAKTVEFFHQLAGYGYYTVS